MEFFQKAFFFSCTFALLFTFTLISCRKDPTVTPESKQIDFETPVVNQENTYLRYFGFCDFFNPTKDTLIVKVVGFNGHELQLKESFTPGSPMFVYHPDSFTYGVAWTKDYLITTSAIRAESNLFFFFEADTLWLSKPPSLTLRQDQCRVYNDTLSFEGSAIGSIPTFNVGLQNYLHKNVVTQVPPPDTILIWDNYMVFDNKNIYAVYQNIKENIYVQSPTVSAYALVKIE